MPDTRATILLVGEELATVEMLPDLVPGRRPAVAHTQNLDEHMARPRRSVGLS